MGLDGVIFQNDTLFLVTGAAGFIGSNLCEALLKLGYRVRGLDNFSTGRRENIAHLTIYPGFEFTEGDITDFDVCLSSCDGANYILHQAAIASVPRSMKYPLLYEHNNIRGTANMMEAAAKCSATKFVYASSSSVYGDSADLPKVEGCEGNPLSPYALTKRATEYYGKLYSDAFSLPCIGLRYFNVFGRRQDPESEYAAVIPKFISLLRRGEQAEFYGDGSQSRDFTYIDNVIEANLKACLAPNDADGEVFNIAFGSSTSLLDAYGIICECLGVSREPVFSAPRAGDIAHSLADITKARRLLRYDPDWSFRAGLEVAIEWYSTNGGSAL